MVYVEKLILEGFEGYSESTTIEFSKGLNVIVGPSNSGKSSILKAFKILYKNEYDGPSLEKKINVDKDMFRITAELSNGYTVIREKNRKTINRYRLIHPDGTEETFVNFREEPVPLEIKEVLKITDKKYDLDNSINFNFLDQIKSSFLVEQSSTEKSKIIGMLRETHYMDESIREINKELRQNSGKINDIDAKIQTKDNSLLRFEYLDEIEKGLVNTEKALSDSNGLLLEIEKLSSLLNDYEIISTELERAILILDTISSEVINSLKNEQESIVVVLDKIEDIVDLSTEYNDVIKKISDLNSILREENDYKEADILYAGIQNEINKLPHLSDIYINYNKVTKEISFCNKALENVKDVFKVSEASEKIFELINQIDSIIPDAHELAAIDKQLHEANKVIAKLGDFEKHERLAKKVQITIPQLETLTTVNTNFNKVSKEMNISKVAVEKTKNTSDVFKSIENIKTEIQNFNEVRDIAIELKNCKTKIKESNNIIAEKTKQFETHLDEYKEVLLGLKTCPICNHDLDNEKILEIIQNYNL